jgi:hypothetical protein
VTAIQTLRIEEINSISGAGVFGDISLAMGAASVIGGGLATIPTPATPALAGFAVLTGLMSVGAAYLDAHVK